MDQGRHGAENHNIALWFIQFCRHAWLPDIICSGGSKEGGTARPLPHEFVSRWSRFCTVLCWLPLHPSTRKLNWPGSRPLMVSVFSYRHCIVSRQFAVDQVRHSTLVQTNKLHVDVIRIGTYRVQQPIELIGVSAIQLNSDHACTVDDCMMS